MSKHDTMAEFRRCNPWTIMNIQNAHAGSGRFPTQEAAVDYARGYRGGVVCVNSDTKTVFVSEIPSL